MTQSPQQAIPAPWFRACLDEHGLQLAGELDVAGLDALRVLLDQALLDGGEVIAIDASRLTFIDSRAIAELLRYELTASASQRQLWLDPVSPRVAEVLEMLDLAHILLPPSAKSAAEGSDPETTETD